MLKSASIPNDAKSLKNELRQRIESLGAENLSLLNGVALQLEAEEVARKLNDEFDRDRATGKITAARVQQIISEARPCNPYK